MAKTRTKFLFDDDEGDSKNQKGVVIRVALDTGADSVFDYILPESIGTIRVGQRVKVPFGRSNKIHQAFCVDVVTDVEQIQKSRKFKLKAVKEIIDKEPLLDEQLMALAAWISEYYVCPLGQVLAAMVPAAVKKGAGIKKEKLIYLSSSSKQAVENLSSKKQKAIVDILFQAGAFGSDEAIEKQQLLEKAECTDVPLKTLIRNGIIKITTRSIIRSLPAIPPSLSDGIQQNVLKLNEDQQKALDRINASLKSGGFGVSLLHGVTDSGKTELYIRAIQTVLELGKKAIVLLPEIALTAQTVQRFSERFKNLAVLHSRLTPPQRNEQWQRIKKQQADVVIGARSAIFAPVSNLGLIVIDEEHEGSYKQDTVPRYHGRDVAIKRSQLAGALCLLGSATPALETFHNCSTKKHFQKLDLTKRVKDIPMPQMKLVDMSVMVKGPAHKAPTLISPQLRQELTEVLNRKEQAILLLNRRGYSNFIFCPSCRYAVHCRNCDVTLTFHRKGRDFSGKQTVLGRHMTGGYAVCHYCLSKTLVPEDCPLCRSRMTMIGLGSQRLVEELLQKFPTARIHRVDSDSMAAHPENYYRLLGDFAEGKIDILAGTQILAKGLHFPNVTLVGIISADTALSLPDFRSNERTFQLISQVAGRAGRGDKPGRVIVQTFLPKQPAINFAMKYDYSGFTAAELEHRKKCDLPPFWRMAIIIMRDVKYEKLQAAAAAMRDRLDEIISTEKLEVKVRGPMPAAISRIQRFHRMQIIVQAPNAAIMSGLFGRLRQSAPLRPAVAVQIDVDPINLL